MSTEQQTYINKRKGSGLQGLVLFSLVSFAVCFAGIFLLTQFWKKKDIKIDKDLVKTGYFDGKTYFNPWLGWKITFPDEMTVLDHNEIQTWRRLPQIPGFEYENSENTTLFLALGEAFSVVSLARLDQIEQQFFLQPHDIILSGIQEEFRQSIINNTPYECFVQTSELSINFVLFKLMEIIFFHNGEEQKRQAIYSSIINEHILHITVVYYNPIAGRKMNKSILESEFFY